MLCVTGQQLYDCEQLPEWKTYMDSYDQYILAEEDERFRHVHAVLDDCPDTWPDENGCYKGRSKPSEWITQGTDLHLGLVDYDGKPGGQSQEPGHRHCQGCGRKRKAQSNRKR
jgi:hypothetical protein